MTLYKRFRVWYLICRIRQFEKQSDLPDISHYRLWDSHPRFYEMVTDDWHRCQKIALLFKANKQRERRNRQPWHQVT